MMFHWKSRSDSVDGWRSVELKEPRDKKRTQEAYRKLPVGVVAYLGATNSDPKPSEFKELMSAKG